ncbi:MAG: hypothetical protein H6967_07755 [Chromatiaceae bacterium]|nr:hypothetical protein [Chromatiaceae bacterium]
MPTPRNGGVTGFEGFGAGIIIPYRIRPDKLVLATWGDHGWEHQAVIEHGSDYSINTKIFDDAILSGDARGTLSLLYRAHIGPSTSTHYTQIALDQEARRTVEWRRPGQPTILLADIPARDAGWLVPFFELAFAVDPQGGATAFLAQQDSGWRPVNGIVVEREMARPGVFAGHSATAAEGADPLPGRSGFMPYLPSQIA